MKNEIIGQKLTAFSNLLSETNELVIEQLNQIVTEHNKTLQSICNILNKKTSIDKPHELIGHYDILLAILNEWYPTIEGIPNWNEFRTTCGNMLGAIKEEPLSEKTQWSVNNEFLLNLKFADKLNIFIHKAAAATLGLFRRIFKSQKQYHARTFYNFFLRSKYLPVYLGALDVLIKECQWFAIQPFATVFENESEPEKRKGLQCIAPEFNNRLDAIKNSLVTDLEQDLWLSLAKINCKPFARFKVNIRYKKSWQAIDKTIKGWQTTFYALAEDWRLRAYTFRLGAQIKKVHQTTEQIYVQRVFNTLLPEIEKQRANTQELLGKIPSGITDIDTIRQFLLKELYKLKKTKTDNEQQQKAQSVVTDIPNLLQKTENEVRELLKQLPNKSGVVKVPDYSQTIKASDIYYFSAAEFIVFDCLPPFYAKNSSIKQLMETKLKTVLAEFNDYDQIIDFYLDTAILLTEKSALEAQQAIQVFAEGLNRLLLISDKIIDLLKDLATNEFSQLTDNLNELVHKIELLENNNNIVAIYTRLIKSKTLAESANKRKKAFDLLQNSYVAVKKYLGNKTDVFNHLYTQLKKKLHLETMAQPISSDLSNYLNETQNRIEKIPIIYQHLFADAPVHEVNLFHERKNEQEILNQAYYNWINNNYAAAAIIGEKGAGKSSLIYHYIDTIQANYQVLSYNVADFHLSENDYYQFINQLFGCNNLTTDAQILDYINAGERKMVFIDGAERLFLRTIGGFVCLQKFLSLVVETNHKLLWVISMPAYTWQYLIKTIQITEYFDFVIELNNLSREGIQNVVLKRQRLSGYEMEYQIPDGFKHDGKDSELVQKQLQLQYFEALQKYAQSNLSIAMIYWLLSVLWKDESRLVIKQVRIPDFDFLNTFSMEKNYLLLLIVVHGKISAGIAAQALDLNRVKVNKLLSILLADSILIKTGDYYTLNRILYPQVIKQLRNKNFIH